MAVYTKISEAQLQQLISNYDIGKLQSFTAIEAGIQNSNYFINTDSARFVLTIYEQQVNYSELPFFLNLLSHLAKKNIPCPAVIFDKSGNAISKIKDKPCAITSFLKGGEAKIIHNIHIEEIGTSMAKMHLASLDFPMRRENNLSVNSWANILYSIKNNADIIEKNLASEIATNLNFLQKNWPQNLPAGIIHADLFPDNVFFNNDKLAGIIDFYFACNDAFIYDIAICMNSWCFDNNKIFNPEKANLLISSYNKIRKITDAELAALPIVALGAAMRFLLSRSYDWLNRVEGALVTPKDPLEYLNKLRFHSQIKSYEEYVLQEIRT